MKKNYNRISKWWFVKDFENDPAYCCKLQRKSDGLKFSVSLEVNVVQNEKDCADYCDMKLTVLQNASDEVLRTMYKYQDDKPVDEPTTKLLDSYMNWLDRNSDFFKNIKLNYT